jgi:predicted RND superfamily exporter protein
MQVPPVPVSHRVFRAMGRHPWWLVAPYLVLVPLAVALLLRIPRAASLESMVPPDDPAVAATRAFRAVFPDTRPAELLLEAPEPFSRETMAAMDRLERAVGGIRGVRAYSLLTVWRRFHPGATGLPAPAQLRRLATGTAFFRRQGLWGEEFLGLALELDFHGPAGRDRLLAAIDRAIARTVPPGLHVARVGSPWINAWLERQSAASTVRFFPLLGLAVVSLIGFLFRSWRALGAILIPLAVSVLLGVAFGGAAGFAFTIVSGLVPLMLMVTTTAGLVYLHSHYVDRVDELPLAEHRARALAEKLLPVSASVLAAGAGFAALAVSPIPPIRQLGLWTAAGLGGALALLTLLGALGHALLRLFRASGKK